MTQQPAMLFHLPSEDAAPVLSPEAAVETPALVLDLERLEANIAAAANWAVAQPKLGLRPHAKTHKCVKIARLQMATGALGICAATLAEAGALAEGGIPDVLLTTPVALPKLPRFVALARKTETLRAAVDNPDYVDALAAEARRQGVRLGVLIDLDPAQGRTGARNVAAALELARRVEAAESLRLDGVQAYYGHLQHVESLAVRIAKVEEQAAWIASIVEALAGAGHAVTIVTGGGTGTHEIDARLGLFTDLQMGSYIFGDVEYASVEREAGGPGRFQPALFVVTSVVSTCVPGQVTTDAGFKSFATDGPAPVVTAGAPAGARYAFAGDAHGRISLPEGEGLPLGARVECLSPHCDPTVNLHDRFLVLRDGRVVETWPVDARGPH